MDILNSFNEEDEVIQHVESNLVFIVDKTTFGKGTLYLAENKLYWKNDSINQVVSVDYNTICIFGTCNHPTIHDKPCLQIILDFTYKPSGNTLLNGNFHENHSVDEEDSDSQENEEEEEEMKSNIKLVPENPERLNEIYSAFKCVQILINGNDLESDNEDCDYYCDEDDEFEDFEDDIEQ